MLASPGSQGESESWRVAVGAG
jgi:TrwC relaxase